MSHMKKSAAGHLLKNTGGHLVNECDPCLLCDPAIPDTLYVTVSGATGVFSPLNGTYAVTWESGCTWRGDVGDRREWSVNWRNNTDEWGAVAATGDGGSCYMQYTGGADPCNPYASYVIENCLQDSCSSPGTCGSLSVSAT